MEIRALILIAIAAAVIILSFLLVKPFPQPGKYHCFADNRTILGIPNCLDVLSNIPFVVVGFLGILCVSGLIREGGDVAVLIPYMTFFAGLFLTGFGSGWYHLKPNNETLVWDRLPMTIAFAGFLCSVLSEVISSSAGTILLTPLLAVGMFSVFYWIRGERKGKGDLRLYGIMQFLPLLLIPLILVLYETPENYVPYLAALLIFYLLAKVLESLDNVVYSLGNIVSGHTLKHIMAATGALFPLLMLYSQIN